MQAKIIERGVFRLVGFNFFGDPFRSYGGWSAENEIGRLWQRWLAYLQNAPPQLTTPQFSNVLYELHIYHPETPQSGEWEVFVGFEVDEFDELPPEVVAKMLPASRYAVFTLVGQEIVVDWHWLLDAEWLPELGVQRSTTFSLQYYDTRFKGMDAIDESELDVYIPLLP